MDFKPLIARVDGLNQLVQSLLSNYGEPSAKTEPESATEPKNKPTTITKPQTQPAPITEPESEPAPEIESKIEPAPVTEPENKPDPVTEPENEPPHVTEPENEPDDSNAKLIEEKIELISPENTRRTTSEGLKKKLRRNFQQMDTDQSGLVRVQEMW